MARGGAHSDSDFGTQRTHGHGLTDEKPKVAESVKLVQGGSLPWGGRAFDAAEAYGEAEWCRASLERLDAR